MATRPAVPGLVKHQLMFGQGGIETGVTTIWTFKAADPPAGQRITDEQAAIVAWVTSHWRQITGTATAAQRLKTWNFGTSPPTKYADHLWVPQVLGTGGDTMHYALCAVVALRSEPIGSAIRNRLNGRIFHPVSAGQATMPAGDIHTTGRTAIIAAYHNLRDRLDPAADADVGDWVVPSFWHNKTLREVPVIIPVDHVLVRTDLGVQVSRVENQPPYARGA